MARIKQSNPFEKINKQRRKAHGYKWRQRRDKEREEEMHRLKEKPYPVTRETLQRRQRLLLGYHRFPGSTERDTGVCQKLHYVPFPEAAEAMGYEFNGAVRALRDGRFEIPVVMLQLPPDYHERSFVRRSQLDAILKAPPARMQKRFKKKGLARSSG